MDGESGSSMGRVLGVLTGASRGFGRSLAGELCSRAAPGSSLLLVARTGEALRSLTEELTLQYPRIAVRWVAADLGTADGVRRTVEAAQELPGQEAANRILLINNAGSLGDISKSFMDITDLSEVDRYFSFNVSSALCLTSSLFKILQKSPGAKRMVVNISSLAALKPFQSWTLYSVGKAARDMMFRVLAEEEKDIRVLNYAPGSLGDIQKSFLDFTDPAEVNRYFSFNVSSALCLTSSLLKTFPPHPGLQRLVVNVTSLAAVQPFRSWTLYCAGKAAREMMFRVLAEEEKDIRVLSYSPGPLDTDMQEQVRTQVKDPEVRLQVINLKKSGKLVPCAVSARKMLDVLQADAFQSGAHVDFFT